jgi:hypothetical protein
MLDISSFPKRLNIGKQASDELRSILESEGFIVSTSGQETWMKPELQECIRHDHSDLTVRAVRYAPDFLAYKTGLFKLSYFEVKRNTTPNTPNFTIEKACYDELISLVDKGEQCVVAFREVNGKWYANYIKELVISKDMSSIRHMARGSMTPYLLIKKISTIPLINFLRN